jgi:hypothetical protein
MFSRRANISSGPSAIKELKIPSVFSSSPQPQPAPFINPPLQPPSRSAFLYPSPKPQFSFKLHYRINPRHQSFVIMSTSGQATTSDIDAEMEQRLGEHGFSPEQIDQMKTAGVKKEVITPILGAELNTNQLQKVFTVYAGLRTGLPDAAKVEVVHHEEEMPTFTTYVRNLSNEDARAAGALYQGLADFDPNIPHDEAYIFDMGRGYVQVRHLYKDGTS